MDKRQKKRKTCCKSEKKKKEFRENLPLSKRNMCIIYKDCKLSSFLIMQKAAICLFYCSLVQWNRDGGHYGLLLFPSALL